MEHLREADVRSLLELITESNAQRSLRAFRGGILPGLRKLVSCDIAAYNEVEPTRGYALSDPADALEVFGDNPGAVLARVSGEHPLIAYYNRTRDGRAYKLSDFVTPAELRATSFYREIFKVSGMEHQIAFTLPSQPSLVIGLSMSRGGRRDFDEHDRSLLNLARPHLIQAYRNVGAFARVQATLQALARGLAERGDGVVTFTREGAIEFISPTARELLQSSFPRWSGRGGRLPDELADALARARAAARGAAGDPGGSAPLLLSGEGRTLVARLVVGRAAGEPDALLIEVRAEPLDVAAVRALGLTGRQAEVLRLVALGRSTEQVAAHLHIAPATVRKHLEHIYDRLGVTSRTAAVATAWAGAETAGIDEE